MSFEEGAYTESMCNLSRRCFMLFKGDIDDFIFGDEDGGPSAR